MTKQGQRSVRSPRTVASAVRPIAAELAATHGLVLWDVSFGKTAGRETLRVACDKPGGIGADDLALFAGDLSRELDHCNAVPGEATYILDVSSPGAERKLHTPEQFGVCIGRSVHIVFEDERAALDGRIAEIVGDHVLIEAVGGTVSIPFEDIASAQLRIAEIG